MRAFICIQMNIVVVWGCVEFTAALDRTVHAILQLNCELVVIRVYKLQDASPVSSAVRGDIITAAPATTGWVNTPFTFEVTQKDGTVWYFRAQNQVSSPDYRVISTLLRIQARLSCRYEVELEP